VALRVSPGEPNPTHHFKLRVRSGESLGLLACDAAGKPLDWNDKDLFVKQPIETTALKQTSGASSYDIFDYPYSPIVQDDLSGGRGGQDFERDGTKYFDSYRCNSGRANKAYAGALEQYATGLRNVDQHMPGSVDWIQMTESNRIIYRQFLSSGLTVGMAWLLARRKGTPGDLTIAIHNNNSGNVGTAVASITVSSTRLADTLSEWLAETISQVLTNGVTYWLVIMAAAGDDERGHWMMGVKREVGLTYASASYTSTPGAATYDLYFRLTPANSEKTCIPFEYKDQQYFVINGATGAPQIFMAGDRGAADANTGQLSRLIDATKSWVTDEHVGSIVMITDGPGKAERQPWRRVTANGSNYLVVDGDWTIAHTTATEYVLLGAKLKQVTGHGLTAPVTDVHVSTTGVIYMMMGDAVAIRALRAFNDSGTWKDFGHADCQRNEGDAKSKAVFMVYKDQDQKLVIANNSDASGDVSVNTSTNVSIPAWGTNLTWGATAVKIGSKFRRITGLIQYPDLSGNEAVWVMKTDMPWIAPGTGNPFPVGLDEMKTVRSLHNGVRPIRHGVYVLFPLLQGLQRYYGGQYDDIGPNIGEGLPEALRGPIVWMQGYPGKYFIAIDAGADGYSSIRESGGWHERYRAPKGQRIRAIAFQVVEGPVLDRLWMYQGNDLVWLPFPSDSTNELNDATYPYTPEFAVELSRMHAGMFDVQKIVKRIKLQTERLEVDANTGKRICWFELDYRLNDDAEWTTIADVFDTSPTQEVDFTNIFGVAGKRLKFRLRGYTRDQYKTPVFLAIIVSAVLRVDVKSMYGPFTFLLEDDQKAMGLREEERGMTAAEKLALLEDWSDAGNDSLIQVSSVASLYDGKLVFMNMGVRRQIRLKALSGNTFTSDAYVVSVTFQEA
jgi:hypothetical protein